MNSITLPYSCQKQCVKIEAKVINIVGKLKVTAQGYEQLLLHNFNILHLLSFNRCFYKALLNRTLKFGMITVEYTKWQYNNNLQTTTQTLLTTDKLKYSPNKFR